jgi:hypothetical protein
MSIGGKQEGRDRARPVSPAFEPMMKRLHRAALIHVCPTGGRCAQKKSNKIE